MITIYNTCIAASGTFADISDRTVDSDALQLYLNIRRGMRACNDTRKAWVLDKALTVKTGQAVDGGLKALRIQTITGMTDWTVADTSAKYMALCRVSTK